MKYNILMAILLMAGLSSCQKMAELQPESLTDTLNHVPYLTIAQLRTGAADNHDIVYINDGLRSGTFQYDANDTSSADDGSMVLVSGSRRYKRASTFVTLEMFGAKGDYNYINKTGTDDTQAIQNALNYCSKSGTEIKLLGGKNTSPIRSICIKTV